MKEVKDKKIIISINIIYISHNNNFNYKIITIVEYIIFKKYLLYIVMENIFIL